MNRLKPAGLTLSLVSALLFFGLAADISGQTRPVTGLHSNTPQVTAFKNARLVAAPGRVLEHAVLVVRDGEIGAAGIDAPIPADAVVRDLEGKTIYPGFIDLYSHYGIERKKALEAVYKDGARHWNPAVRPELRAAQLFQPDEKAAAGYRKAGFTAALTFPEPGIFTGSAALVLLADTTAAGAVLADELAQGLSFEKGEGFPGRGAEGYPASLMGHISLIRQTLLDARWYGRAWQAYNRSPAGQSAPEKNLSLAALAPFADGKSPFLLKTANELGLLRASRLEKEFGISVWALGSGTEYRRLEAVKSTGLKLILPLDFPEPPEVSAPAEERETSLRELKYWDMAPENPTRLSKAGIQFTLSASGLSKPEEFLDRLRRAVKRGLPADRALAALTTIPADWLGLSRQLGTLEPGKLANFFITDGDLFEKKTKILETWVAGKRHEIVEEPLAEPRGKWDLTVSSSENKISGSLELSGEISKLKSELTLASHKIGAQNITLDKRTLSFTFPADSLGLPGVARLAGTVIGDTIRGAGSWSDGSALTWQALRSAPPVEKPDTATEKPESSSDLTVVYPDGAFGRLEKPAQPAVLLIKGATIWTCGSGGVIEHADLLVRAGRIAAVGRELEAPAGALVLDGTGKHVTPGLIDAHSHMAIEGNVNEMTDAITAEVRIADVIDCDDIDIYRQLAGGITSALIIHGSANPIGGQGVLIKLRWGALPEEMKFEGAKPVIKFALGENVTQAARPDPVRFQASRMGVERFFRDWFAAAKDYRRELESYERLKKSAPDRVPPRRDLRLEALLEVLDSELVVHCHSYRQDEILAMLRTADAVGFKIGVLIHVLEGYKVAEAIRAHGAMPTTFSDWWAYKYEVIDAIPYNGPLMHEQGLVVSFNSDDAELARHMNLEAAKAVKYGGVEKVEALKFVTANPAAQLRVSDRVGRLEPGLDADFAVWSGDPLSSYSVCEQTWIDGRKYFDRQEDSQLRRTARAERLALIQKILSRGSGKKEAN